jgi:hypothetical protein
MPVCTATRTSPLRDLNNEAVADELSKWLHRKGLDKFAGE